MSVQGPDLNDLFEQLRREKGSAGSGSGPSFVDQVAAGGKRALIIAAVVLVVALVVCYWWFHPSLNLGSQQVWTWICGIALLAILVLAVAAARSIKRAELLKKLVVLPGAVIAAFLASPSGAGFELVRAGLTEVPGGSDTHFHAHLRRR